MIFKISKTTDKEIQRVIIATRHYIASASDSDATVKSPAEVGKRETC
jgi:hypothetical protein